MNELYLNLGCGSDYRKGYVNVDDNSMWHGGTESMADAHYNLNHFPWPFEDNSADEILMNHVLEHLLDTASVLCEVKRILKPGGLFWGQVPYGPSKHGHAHWQHCKFFIDSSFHDMAKDFGFDVVVAQNVTIDSTCKWYNWMYACRNLVPFKKHLAKLGWSEAYDSVDFKLRKK